MLPADRQQYGTQNFCIICDVRGAGGVYLPREKPTLWWSGVASCGEQFLLCDNCKDELWDVRPWMESYALVGL